jgi:hypothetical protein
VLLPAITIVFLLRSRRRKVPLKAEDPDLKMPGRAGGKEDFAELSVEEVKPVELGQPVSAEYQVELGGREKAGDLEGSPARGMAELH